MTNELNRIESIDDSTNEHLLNEIYERLDALDKEMVRRNIGWTKLRLRKWILEEIRNIKHDIKRSV
jgi:polyribonucleotide nucleotidyltransferase